MRRLALAPLSLSLLLAGCSGGDDPLDGGTEADGSSTPIDSGVIPDAGPQACESWLIEYDLSGSEFEIRNTPFGAGDAVNAVGPGRLQLRFPGQEGGPELGEVVLVRYELAMEFEVAGVATDVDVTAGPEDCGVAMGTRTSSVVEWSTPIADYRSMGTVTCNATEFLCAAAGLPVGEPVARDSTHVQPLMPFVFGGADDFSSFTMAEVEVPNDDAGDTFLRLEGVQTSRSCVPLPTSCE